MRMNDACQSEQTVSQAEIRFRNAVAPGYCATPMPSRRGLGRPKSGLIRL